MGNYFLDTQYVYCLVYVYLSNIFSLYKIGQACVTTNYLANIISTLMMKLINKVTFLNFGLYAL